MIEFYGGQSGKRETCEHGHAYPDNLYINPDTGARMCRTCRRIANKGFPERTTYPARIGYKKEKTCKRGHAYTPGHGCQTCKKMADASRRKDRLEKSGFPPPYKRIKQQKKPPRKIYRGICKRGHPLTPDNLYDGKCRICRNIKHKIWRARRIGKPIDEESLYSLSPTEYKKELGRLDGRRGRRMNATVRLNTHKGKYGKVYVSTYVRYVGPEGTRLHYICRDLEEAKWLSEWINERERKGKPAIDIRVTLQACKELGLVVKEKEDGA